MKQDGKPGDTEPTPAENRITSLLQLKTRLEQELRADTRKINDLKADCELKVAWIHHLDEILSEASFQPASALLDMSKPIVSIRDEDEIEKEEIPATVTDFSKPVNIMDKEGNEILAMINFLSGNILIAFGTKVAVDPENPIFQEFFNDKILARLEKEGGKTFLERDEVSGMLRSISVMGSFPTEVKEAVVKGVQHVLLLLENASSPE
jgi:hypothetical protein